MLRLQFLILFILSVYLCGTFGLVPQFYRVCQSPYNDTGLCVHFEDCPFLYMQRLSELSEEKKILLKKSQCGYDNDQTRIERKILICCPDKFSKDPTYTDVANVLPEPGICGSYLGDRIVGGVTTKIDEFPWMALIAYKKSNTTAFHCGGSLINSRYVLTAAHCLNTVDKTNGWEFFSVRLGEWNIETDPDCITDIRGKLSCAPKHQDIMIERAIQHGKYIPDSTDQYYDIGLLRLAKSVSYSQFIKPICLPLAQQLRHSSYTDTVMDVAGWGITEDDQPSKIKMKIMVDIWDITECHKKYQTYSPRIPVDGTLQLCAGGKADVDACRGDSGGPLMVTEKVANRSIVFVAGVVSYGPKPCGFKGWPGVYTNVGYFVNWIVDNIED